MSQWYCFSKLFWGIFPNYMQEIKKSIIDIFSNGGSNILQTMHSGRE